MHKEQRRTMHRLGLTVLAAAALIFVVGMLVPESPLIPVRGASTRDWNPRSFWYEPWGASGVHKGIDIFAPRGRSVVAPTSGLVLYRGRLGIGGNVVAMLGPKWRIHYIAHLEAAVVPQSAFVRRGELVGYVGTSGNAAGKPPHLHYAIGSLVPLPWKATLQTQGWKRMFFVDPGAYLQAAPPS